MDSVYVDTGLLCRVPPFRNLRINAYLQLPEAYRSLSRLSSAPDAKAFPLYSLQLDLVGASSTSLASAKRGESSLVPLRLLSVRNASHFLALFGAMRYQVRLELTLSRLLLVLVTFGSQKKS